MIDHSEAEWVDLGEALAELAADQPALRLRGGSRSRAYFLQAHRAALFQRDLMRLAIGGHFIVRQPQFRQFAFAAMTHRLEAV